MMDKVVEPTNNANAKKSCLGYSWKTNTCTLNYGVQLSAAAAGAGKCEYRKRSVKALLVTGGSSVFPMLETLVTLNAGIATGLATKGSGTQFDYDAKSLIYFSQHYCTANTCTTSNNGAGIKAEQKVLMEIEYLKQLQIKMNTMQDAYAAFSVASDGAGSPKLVQTAVASTWKGKYDAAVTALETKNTGIKANTDATNDD
jgi:hypothetical protein